MAAPVLFHASVACVTCERRSTWLCTQVVSYEESNYVTLSGAAGQRRMVEESCLLQRTARCCYLSLLLCLSALVGRVFKASCPYVQEASEQKCRLWDCDSKLHVVHIRHFQFAPVALCALNPLLCASIANSLCGSW